MKAILLALGIATVSFLPLAAALPTPAANVGDRVFPEALETTDFISFAEFQTGLSALNDAHSELLEVIEVGQSFGWDNTLSGAHDTFPVYAVEVTNEASAKSREEKKAVVFQLSIHGNEKGGRERGMRVIEDLVSGRYYGDAIRAALDELILVFTFPNVDGWMHEELEYRTNCPSYFAVPDLVFEAFGQDSPIEECVETQSYVRYNGKGVDLNRDYPTLGWYDATGGSFNGGERGAALSEPETAALAEYVLQFKGRTAFATDIHGMLNPADGAVIVDEKIPFIGSPTYGQPVQCLPEEVPVFGGGCLRNGHFVLSLIPSAQWKPTDHLRNTRLAELVKERLNTMAAERYPFWTMLPNLGYAGGDFNEYGTTWDTIGYTDSGTTGEFFAQMLDAEGFDFELSYNHITFDDKYIPILNDIHVNTVREIVGAYVEAALVEVYADVKTNGHKAGYLVNPVSTQPIPAEGPHVEASADDAFELKVRADVNDFFADVANVLDGPFVGLTVEEAKTGALSRLDRFVVAGRASDALLGDAAAVKALKSFVEAGGKLVVTDSAMRLLPLLGIASEGDVGEARGYLGFVDLVRENPLAKDVRGLAREFYNGLTLGYQIPFRASDESNYVAPIWTVSRTALESASGVVAGTSRGADQASLGEVPLGKGSVVFLGALLAPPTTEYYHPYGLASHAVTATGFQVLYNALDFTVSESETPRGFLDLLLQPTGGDGERAQTPGFEVALLGAATGAVAIAMRRRR